MRQRFARLMNNEEGAWVRPSAPEPDLSQPMPVRTAPTTSQHPTEEDEYDSDDPEQVCNARFAPPPPKTTGRNARIRGRGKQSAKQPAAPTSSANPVLLKQLEKKVFPSLGLSIGERSKYALAFVPWKLVVEYPQHFVGKTNFNKVCHRHTGCFQDLTQSVFVVVPFLRPPRTVQGNFMGLVSVLNPLPMLHLVPAMFQLLNTRKLLPPPSNKQSEVALRLCSYHAI
jgi:hypothetical protein